jgi:hypothetical protein
MTKGNGNKALLIKIGIAALHLSVGQGFISSLPYKDDCIHAEAILHRIGK